jgi:hypothetical protein
MVSKILLQKRPLSNVANYPVDGNSFVPTLIDKNYSVHPCRRKIEDFDADFNEEIKAFLVILR